MSETGRSACNLNFLCQGRPKTDGEGKEEEEEAAKEERRLRNCAFAHCVQFALLLSLFARPAQVHCYAEQPSLLLNRNCGLTRLRWAREWTMRRLLPPPLIPGEGGGDSFLKSRQRSSSFVPYLSHIKDEQQVP